MNKRGIIFSFSMLFLILSFVLLQQSANRTTLMHENTATTLKSFQTLNEFYNNINRNMRELDSRTSYKETQERILPFDYGIDENYIYLEHNVPIRAATLGKYFDLVNSFKIFIEDTNYSNYYSGIVTQLQANQNEAWGGVSTALNFVVEPSCMNISMDENRIGFSSSWCGEFDLNDTRTIDSNITINSPGEDLNFVSCLWGGSFSCPNDSFDDLDPRPFFSLKIFDENCSACGFGFTEVKGHFEYSQNNWVSIHCVGDNCVSPQIDLNLTDSFSITRDKDAVPVIVNTGILLKNKIRKLYFNDLNISLSILKNDLSMENQR